MLRNENSHLEESNMHFASKEEGAGIVKQVVVGNTERSVLVCCFGKRTTTGLLVIFYLFV